MAVYLFPGQGSQSKGMGNDLFNQFPDLIKEADAILGYSIQALCLEDADNKLNQTQYTQPALYTVNALTYLKKCQDSSRRPDYVAGHSLGEYNALLAAGVFDFQTGLKLVKKRGELMSHASNGTMAAIIGLPIDTIKAILLKINLGSIAIANYNSYMQFVISGLKDEVMHALPIFEKEGAMMVLPLKVSGAFHSSLMQEAHHEFANYLQQFTLTEPTIPVVANRTANPYQQSELYNHLSQQITHPVRWTESIEYLLAQGQTEFEEIGPGTVLTGLVRRIKNGQ